MRQLYIKQKVFTIGEKFTVYDQMEQAQYFVEGSFMQIPKNFTIYNRRNEEIAKITKKVFSWMPKFYVDIRNNPQIMIEKELTFFKARYQISAEDITVNGDWWDMEFEICRRGRPIARISQKWFTWGDTYEVNVLDESLEELIISLVIAIDCVKSDESSSASSGSF